MTAKYEDGSNVKIREIKNPFLIAKYPDSDQCVGQTGKVIHSHYVGQSYPDDDGKRKKDQWMYYMYIVQLNKNGDFVSVPEDALKMAKPTIPPGYCETKLKKDPVF